MRHNGPVTSFSDRHIGPDPDSIETMLSAVGQPSLAALVDAAVPASIRKDDVLVLPPPKSEHEVLAALQRLARRNTVQVSMIGQGYHDTVTPMVIRRNVLENPAWYTAYTPYQAEISQGRLEAMLNFQTMVADLTALPVAGASLLDEATAVSEAMLLMRRAVRGKEGGRIVLDAECLPQTVEVVRAQAEAIGLPLEVAVLDGSWTAPEDLVGLVVQQPGQSGVVREIRPLIEAAHAVGGLVTVAADILSLCVIKAPGELGADIAVGSTQRFGVPLFFGGPHAAYMAVREGLERQLPGRLVGVSVDSEGRRAYRLALQTREQHIRRDKATSNICTAQALLAIISSFYAIHHGPEGLREIALRVHTMASTLADALRAKGVKVRHEHFFDTVVIEVPRGADSVVARIAAQGINVRKLDADSVAIACDEVTTTRILSDVLSAVLDRELPWPVYTGPTVTIPIGLRRTSEYLTHPIFSAHRSETSLMRYMRRLADRDLALDRTMIPLGSCTMKLNAAVEMAPVSWPGFAQIHPFAPADQTAGYREMISQLEGWLADITGYAAVSVQPNAGSRGEYAGLHAIREYHRSRGDDQRDVCLIPASAHGTNAASAVLVGMRVVVVATAPDGEVDLEDLRSKLAAHEGRVSCIMITYPSTHGVYEEHVGEVCAAVHEAGGQVYIDGANLNALVGLAKPGHFGGDVSHLNLHKTFCIPHGGGGPGVGPVAVAEHLVPFLPRSLAAVQTPGELAREGAPVSAAPYGSAGILAISWAYIAMMGHEGLTRATQTAVLAANYVAARLDGSYPVLFRGPGGLVAHECILDIRPLTKATGITAEDIAKRLIDFGIHAPTMSFPVAGTLMVEPTESEDLAEIERFIEAMLVIREEIAAVERGEIAAEASALRHAPHTADAVVSDSWDRAYPREQAAFPVAGLRQDKYWSPVARIDNAHGDRNLVCACPPLEEYQA
ncbi:aminomethyl-transferring glycine dehydrogenase [Demequina lignilytica]|uniref:Glycine dehydrogenase (decarboxylating) n=1 Tax=Demequina lignilytica TaxID=3051663 RepID=A0AB35MHV6_9MICO|nr:aminomethyl-transferring glycine dehydrogenase [Demequina sp. SYSU T0a273]MDN4483386.1 aminomethyl-transferring glycine dehydrogenase [Demequina sp. SYSU T0a273]